MPDLIVIRAAPDLPEEFRLPPNLDGTWFDLETMPQLFHEQIDGGVAVPTGRFEVRDSDGAVAEIYEIRI